MRIRSGLVELNPVGDVIKSPMDAVKTVGQIFSINVDTAALSHTMSANILLLIISKAFHLR